MSLIKSISGMRGTIGGQVGEGLTPPDIVSLTAAYAFILKRKFSKGRPKVILGRDGRVSGKMVSHLVVGTLLSQGIDVFDLTLASTPSVAMAIIQAAHQGGIMISASHNPSGWNALKFFDEQGEIISLAFGKELLELAESGKINFSKEEELGSYQIAPDLKSKYLQAVSSALLVNKEAITQANFKVVVDGINSVGGLIIPELLHKLGVREIIRINCQPTGNFAHPPEPLAKNLKSVGEAVRTNSADLGIVVDPDVDRLAFIDENGVMISEEYTLVAVSDYVLSNFDTLTATRPGRYNKTTVSNLSSSRALADISSKHGGHYEATAVGEIKVVEKMKELKAVIGGEGNGGIIYPELHYGRDALIGLALYLSALAKSGQTISTFNNLWPKYFMFKDKLDLTSDFDWLEVLDKIKKTKFSLGSVLKIIEIDGLKLEWGEAWLHLRASNTEPIIRIYSEAKDELIAQSLVNEIKDKILAYIK